MSEDTFVRLNKLSDQLNEKIIEIEKYINSLNIGLFVWVDLTENTKLGYIKKDGVWGIHVSSKDEDGNKNIWKLTSAPRTLKIYCYPHIPVIIPALQSAAEEMISSIENILFLSGASSK